MKRAHDAALLQHVQLLTEKHQWIRLICLLKRLRFADFRIVCVKISWLGDVPRFGHSNPRTYDRPEKKIPKWARHIPPEVQQVIYERLWPSAFQEPRKRPHPEFLCSVEETIEAYAKRIKKRQAIYHPKDRILRPDSPMEQPGPGNPTHHRSRDKIKSKLMEFGSPKLLIDDPTALTDAQLMHDFLHNDHIRRGVKRKLSPTMNGVPSKARSRPLCVRSVASSSRPKALAKKAKSPSSGRRTPAKRAPRRRS